MQRRKAGCPPKMMSMNTLSILWRTTRTQRLLGMATIPVPCHWTRAPVLPTPCAGTIELWQMAQKPVTPLSMVAVEGMPTVLGPARPVNAAALPGWSRARELALSRAEAQMMS